MSKDKMTALKVIWIVLVFAAVLSTAAGALTAKSLSAEEADMLKESVELSGLAQQGAEHLHIFKTAALGNLFYALIIMLGAMAVFLAPAVLAVVIFRSFSFGFTAGYFIRMLGLSGFWVSSLAVLPQAVFYMSAFVLLGAASAERAVCCFVNRRDFAMRQILSKKLFVSAAASGVLIIIGAGVECALSGVWTGLLK